MIQASRQVVRPKKASPRSAPNAPLASPSFGGLLSTTRPTKRVTSRSSNLADDWTDEKTRTAWDPGDFHEAFGEFMEHSVQTTLTHSAMNPWVLACCLASRDRRLVS